MVMELVEGITLKEYIEREREDFLIKRRSVLRFRCAKGIGAKDMHRELSIIGYQTTEYYYFQGRKGKVTDFGIAKAITSNTVGTNAMGSVHYTSPEQVRGGFSGPAMIPSPPRSRETGKPIAPSRNVVMDRAP